MPASSCCGWGTRAKNDEASGRVTEGRGRHHDSRPIIIMSLAMLAASAFAFTAGPLTMHPFHRHRSCHVVAFENDPSTTNVQTENGLSWTLMRRGGGVTPVNDQIVVLSYTATLVSTSRVVDGNDNYEFVWGQDTKMQRGRKFAWGTPASASPLLPLFQEAIDGMAIGDVRRVNVPPSSVFASLKDETVQFEIELKGITTGTDATLYRMAQFWKQANIGPFVIVAFFVLFLQQDLQELFQAFLPAPMSMSERAAESLGM